ncbi:MAG: ATP-dependent Clp protease adaptor ClpS [Planctomycetota bacterium]
MSEASTMPVYDTTTDQSTESEWPKPWNVVLLDDDDHTYDYVVRLAMDLFAHPLEQAFQIAKAVDEDGRAVLRTTHRELAELKAEQVRAFGVDQLVSECVGSMTAIIEPAE